MQNDTHDDKVTLSMRPLHKPGAPLPEWGRYWCLDSEVEREALHFPGSLVVAIHEDGRRAIMLSLRHVGVRQLATPEPASTIRYGEPGAPPTPPADWLAVWDEGTDPIEMAAYLGHITPLVQMRATAAVARLALTPLDGDLHRDLLGALDAVDAHLSGLGIFDILKRYSGQLHQLQGDQERRGDPDYQRHAVRAVTCAVERAYWSWNLPMAKTNATMLCDAVRSTWQTLDLAPEYVQKRQARPAASFSTPRDASQPHPEIAAVLRDVVGDVVYTSLPSTPVTGASGAG